MTDNIESHLLNAVEKTAAELISDAQNAAHTAEHYLPAPQPAPAPEVEPLPPALTPAPLVQAVTDNGPAPAPEIEPLPEAPAIIADAPAAILPPSLTVPVSFPQEENRLAMMVEESENERARLLADEEDEDETNGPADPPHPANIIKTKLPAQYEIGEIEIWGTYRMTKFSEEPASADGPQPVSIWRDQNNEDWTPTLDFEQTGAPSFNPVFTPANEQPGYCQ